MLEQYPWLPYLAIGGIFLLVLTVILARSYRKVPPGQALIINTTGKEPRVTFTGGLVLPILHRGDFLDISMKTLVLDRHGSDALVCSGKVRADIKVAFYVRVNKTTDDVLRVASVLGCERASDPATLEGLFASKFLEALQIVAGQLDFEKLSADHERFRNEVLSVIGRDLNGYLLDDMIIVSLERGALSSVNSVDTDDSNSSLDARSVHRTEQVLGRRDRD